MNLFNIGEKNLVVSMERTFVQTDSKGAYLKSELDSEPLYIRDSAGSCGANPTSAPTAVGATDPCSDTGMAATEADSVCSAKDTREMADGLQIAGTNISGAHALWNTSKGMEFPPISADEVAFLRAGTSSGNSTQDRPG